MTCTCNWCQLHHHVTAVKAITVEPEAQELIDELFEHASMVEDEHEYYRAILDGSWPEAVEILEAALERAREKRKEKANS